MKPSIILENLRNRLQREIDKTSLLAVSKRIGFSMQGLEGLSSLVSDSTNKDIARLEHVLCELGIQPVISYLRFKPSKGVRKCRSRTK